MRKGNIRVLRSGDNTLTRLRFSNGAPEHTLERVGTGRFLSGEFTEISAARAYADSEVRKDPSAVLFIVTDNKILDEVMDHRHQERKDKKDRFVYAAVSSAAVFIISLCISLFVMPFTSVYAHVLFTGVMTLLYVAALVVFGARSILALILIGIIMVMALFLAPAIQELVKPEKMPQATAPTVGGPGR